MSGFLFLSRSQLTIDSLAFELDAFLARAHDTIRAIVSYFYLPSSNGNPNFKKARLGALAHKPNVYVVHNGAVTVLSKA